MLVGEAGSWRYGVAMLLAACFFMAILLQLTIVRERERVFQLFFIIVALCPLQFSPGMPLPTSFPELDPTPL